jgi:NADH-quinone oxidoreductase subunit J
MVSDLLLFIPLALIAIASAAGMLLSRNAMYSALNLIINFGSVAVFYLILNASFIALAQVTVYAGAIMVLFLFVIMLLGADQLRAARTRGWQETTALIAGAILLVEAAYVIFFHSASVNPYPPVGPDYGSATAVGMELYSHYLLPFEVTSVLLLVAMIGAIILSKRRTQRARTPVSTQPTGSVTTPSQTL